MAHGWTKWSADLPSGHVRKGGGYGERGWDVPSTTKGNAATVANQPLKVVLLVNVGHPRNTYPNPGPWDGPNSTKNPWGPAGRLTLTTWKSLGLTTGEKYTARDVFSQELLMCNSSGFVANVTGYNATLVLIAKG